MSCALYVTTYTIEGMLIRSYLSSGRSIDATLGSYSKADS